ncbi:hypothetical protein ACFVX9_30575 [Kitasatospora sp. NPDC058243]|uniref:hypothetical protein n=1 Tax=Kitasatospora sp. NPDC058243 TaxID=3346397 RepID=UPI0036D9281B
MTARRRLDPADRAEAYGASLTTTVVPEENQESARRYVAQRARGEADLSLLLAALGLDQPAG